MTLAYLQKSIKIDHFFPQCFPKIVYRIVNGVLFSVKTKNPVYMLTVSKSFSMWNVHNV